MKKIKNSLIKILSSVGLAFVMIVFSFLVDFLAFSTEAKPTTSNPSVGDSFGGDVALVRAYLSEDKGTVSGSAFLFPKEGTWVEEAKPVASDAAAQDIFGYSVSISGSVALVGAPQNDDMGLLSGSAYVYRDNGVFWIEEQKLVASDAAAHDFFGWSVSISGDVVLVGAWGDDDLGTDSGSAYVYRYNGISWVEEQKLMAIDGLEGDLFGRSVSLSGNVALVGAWGNDDNGAFSGSAYVYRYNGTSWVEEQKLVASDAAPGDLFGRSVAINGDVALLGAWGDDDAGSLSGSAYVYRHNGTMWVEEQKLVANDAAAGDIFGASVSNSGDMVLVGAYGDDDVGSLSGSAYVYRYNGTMWVEEQKLVASDGAAGDLFGISVSISGSMVLVGAYENDAAGLDSGSAYVYHYNGTMWVEEQMIVARDAAGADSFGWTVSISGEVILIGAHGNNDAGSNSGSAYLFTVGHELAITKAGTGNGTISSTPLGIDCGVDCTHPYDTGTVVTLTATPGTGSGFTGWSGDLDCSDGQVTMTSMVSCTATFTLNTHTLTMNTSGTGSGTVIGGGVYNFGDTATVSATADSGSTFAGWTGTDGTECATGLVSMVADKTCTARFIFNARTLTINTPGTGFGTVIGAGVYNFGDTATVSATSDAGSTFNGWSGVDGVECATGFVLMDADKSCTATFDLNPKLVNISTRGFVGTGENVMIGGFFINGPDQMTLLIRAQGPSLAGSVPGVLSNPTMQLFSGSTVIAQSDDWQTTDPLCLSPATVCGDAQDIIDTGLDPCTAGPFGCTQESAMLVTLPPGGYTAIVSGVGGGTGVGLVEIFEISGISGTLLVNLSTRDFVGTGDNVMIGGLFVAGNAPKTIIIRAIGPTLPVGGAMSNPTMQLFSGATVIAQNDDWQTTDPLCLAPAVSCGDYLDIIAAGLAPSDANESAIQITLPAGGYTVIVSGVGGTTGIGLVEVFEVP